MAAKGAARRADPHATPGQPQEPIQPRTHDVKILGREVSWDAIVTALAGLLGVFIFVHAAKAQQGSSIVYQGIPTDNGNGTAPDTNQLTQLPAGVNPTLSPTWGPAGTSSFSSGAFVGEGTTTAASFPVSYSRPSSGAPRPV